MYQFVGVMKNELRPEPGVNMTIKGLEEDRLILAPTGPWHNFEKEQESNTLTITIAPSSGTTEGREIHVEMKNGTENITTNPSLWEVQFTSSSDSEPTNIDLNIVYSEEEEE
jgi:hypothetical protein